jgi:NitT/TauT family transport system substrate-binding protein
MRVHAGVRPLLVVLACGLATAVGCKDEKAGDGPTTGPAGAPAPTLAKVRLTLDWKPEPEFGGFYAAEQSGAFERGGLDVEIKSAGPGAPTWQLVANGKTEFATTAADQVLIGRSQGADVVALFAVYQTSPQAVMAHRARGFTSLKDVFQNDGVLAAEDNAWLQHCRKQFAPVKVKLTGYGGGVAGFLGRRDYAQQCFVFSEPILARKQEPAADPQTFLVAESGYNPYTTVVITSGETLRTHPARARAMAEACRAGWRAYLDDPAPANQLMSTLNTDMDLDTFTQGAAAQKPLIETDETKALGLGGMTAARWSALAQQLLDLGVLKNAPPAESCFVDAATLAQK